MSQLSTNTTDLRSILAQVNALPDEGSNRFRAIEDYPETCGR